MSFYPDKVNRRFTKPKNVGVAENANVGGKWASFLCGISVRFSLRIDSETKEIIDAKFKAFGCGSAIASSSLVSEWVKGKNIDEALKIKNTEIAQHLSLPPVKLHCSILAEDAIKAAVNDYKNKNNNA